MITILFIGIIPKIAVCIFVYVLTDTTFSHSYRQSERMNTRASVCMCIVNEQQYLCIRQRTTVENVIFLGISRCTR